MGYTVPPKQFLLLKVVQLEGAQRVFIGSHQLFCAFAQPSHAHTKAVSRFGGSSLNGLSQNTINILTWGKYTHHAVAALILSQKTAVSTAFQIIPDGVECHKTLEQLTLVGELIQLAGRFLTESKTQTHKDGRILTSQQGGKALVQICTGNFAVSGKLIKKFLQRNGGLPEHSRSAAVRHKTQRLSHCLFQFCCGNRLEQVIHRTAGQSLLHILKFLVAADKNKFRCMDTALVARHQFQAGQSGHTDVRDDQIWLLLQYDLLRGKAVNGFAHDLDIQRRPVDKLAQALNNQVLVIRQKYFQHALPPPRQAAV